MCPFLEEHKEDILCGPVWLATGLDLSGHAGMLTLTSPKLVKGKPVYYATHMKYTWLKCMLCFCSHTLVGIYFHVDKFGCIKCNSELPFQTDAKVL